MKKLIDYITENVKLTDMQILKKFGGNNFYACNLSNKDIPILFMAHADIVGGREKIFRKINKYVYKCIGADDRLGVSIIEMLYNLYKINFLITNGEECGGVGAKQFTQTNKKDILKDIKLIVAFDKDGSSHYVKYNDVENEIKLEKYLSKVGLFEEKTGTYSDCLDISDWSGIAHINVAIGYHKEHTLYEYFNINETEYAFYVAKNMCKNPPKEKFTIGNFYPKHDKSNDIFYYDKCYLYKKYYDETVDEEEDYNLYRKIPAKKFKEYKKNGSFKKETYKEIKKMANEHVAGMKKLYDVQTADELCYYCDYETSDCSDCLINFYINHKNEENF